MIAKGSYYEHFFKRLARSIYYLELPACSGIACCIRLLQEEEIFGTFSLELPGKL